MTQDSHRVAANAIRALTMDAVEAAGNGHPGMPMGMADVAVVLWRDFLKHNPTLPNWPDRDRFVQSAGHGSMLIYSLLHLSGYALTLEDLKQYRKWGSKTPGHPEHGHTVGVETTTGPLGQGISTAVGMALAERWMAATYNRPDFNIVDHHTYVIASDGDLMEGVSHEAASIAGHLALSKLIVLYDDNGISIDGPTSISFSEDIPGRFNAYGWHTQSIDGHDHAAIQAAIEAAKAETGRPSLIACKTHIGFGSPNMQDTSDVHGKRMGPEEVRLTKEALDWPVEPPFHVPESVYTHMQPQAGGAEAQEAWNKLFTAYAAAHPELAAQYRLSLKGELPAGWDAQLPTFESGTAIATRNSSGSVLNGLTAGIPWLIGSSADLTGSNKTLAKGIDAISKEDYSGRYLYAGIREHGMGAVLNGMSLHGGIRPFGGTFLVFSDYMRGAVRLSALMKQPVIYVFSHDSIGLGEDGPTHQPVEHIMSLRLIPNLDVIRPADARETAAAWKAALRRTDGPTALILTRQSVPTLENVLEEGAMRGAYVMRDSDGTPDVLLMATGSEVPLALAAYERLAADGVNARVISMPCFEQFQRQDQGYRNAVLPPSVKARVAIEAGATLGWERYTGSSGAIIGIDTFGASAAYQLLYEQFGITVDAMVAAALQQLQPTV